MANGYKELSNRIGAPMPTFDGPLGPWRCGCGFEDESHADFIEVHPSSSGKNIVKQTPDWRVCARRKTVELGPCMIATSNES